MAPKRKRSETNTQHDDNDDDDDDDNNNRHQPTKRFAYLQPQIRNVSERTIKSKWTTLPEPVQEKIRDLFHALERPVIVRQQNERKRIEAQAAVQAVVKNLARRLPRMPFPPGTKETSFEYEAALDEHRVLESHLATMMDSINLLKAEIAREEGVLAKETKQLREMEKNAKRAEAERKRQMKNEHPVLAQLDQRVSTSPEFALADTPETHLDLDENADPEVTKLVKQLRSHLQSMRNNTAPLVGLRDAISRAQAALSMFSGVEG